MVAIFGKRMKYIKVKSNIHKALKHIAVEEDVDFQDLVTAVLERALRDGLVHDVIDEEFPEREEGEEESEAEGGE